MILGLLTSFFDFLTLEVLTFSLPLCIFLILRDKKKNISIKEILVYFIIWFLSYITPFLIKWIINYCYFGKDILISIIKRGYSESYKGIVLYDFIRIINVNTKLILPFYNFNCGILVILLLAIFSYNLIGNKEYKLLYIVFIICLLRLFIIPLQSINLTFTTFRHLMPIWLFIIYILIKLIYNALKNKKQL